jgi:hypothetical protein
MSRVPDCNAPLKQFARRQFSHWQGLVADCTRADLDALFPRDDDWIGTGMLGEGEYDYIWLSSSGYENPVRAWLDGERLALLEVESPALANPTRLLSALGEPDARLDAYRYTVLVTAGEWVYARRGLTLFVYPTENYIYHLAVYAPCSVAEYEHNLRPDLKVTRLSLRRQASGMDS